MRGQRELIIFYSKRTGLNFNHIGNGFRLGMKAHKTGPAVIRGKSVEIDKGIRG
jgi:hypothetical protein